MNEGMENHHKITWRLYDHTARGGCQGNPWTKKTADGKRYIKDGTKRAFVAKAVTEEVMKRQARVLFNILNKSWDKAVWLKAGLQPPARDEVSRAPPRRRRAAAAPRRSPPRRAAQPSSPINVSG